jgi:hypothetical protein
MFAFTVNRTVQKRLTIHSSGRPTAYGFQTTAAARPPLNSGVRPQVLGASKARSTIIRFSLRRVTCSGCCGCQCAKMARFGAQGGEPMFLGRKPIDGAVSVRRLSTGSTFALRPGIFSGKPAFAPCRAPSTQPWFGFLGARAPVWLA